MNDLFTSNQIGRFCIHLATNTLCIVRNVGWYKGGLDYGLLVPRKDEKGNVEFCDAVYSQQEIELLNIWIEPIK